MYIETRQIIWYFLHVTDTCHHPLLFLLPHFPRFFPNSIRVSLLLFFKFSRPFTYVFSTAIPDIHKRVDTAQSIQLKYKLH